MSVAALVVELEALGETTTYEDVFCEAAMQLSAALKGVFDSPPRVVGPRSLKLESDLVHEDGDD